MLKEHLSIKEEDRNKDWDEKFFKLFSETDLKILSEDPQQGPDGWPYLITETIEKADSLNERVDSSQKILRWLSDKGIGLVVNPKRLPYPDYVFSYGMIWSFRETGYFIRYNDLNSSGKFELSEKTKINAGPPTDKYLPLYVRAVLRDFFRDQGVFAPRVLMISADGQNYDLCFSLESIGQPPEAEHEGILEALAWFLPPHYTLAVVSELGLPPFVEL